MKSFREGQPVTLVGDGSELDGIVVHAASLVKVEVALLDVERRPMFRTVHPKTLRERSSAGEHDEELRQLIRRTRSAGRAGPRGGPRDAYDRRGHSHASGHRTTGK